MESWELSEEDRARVQKLLSNPLHFPREFKDWLTDWLAQNIPPIPVSQMLGFIQTRAHVAEDVPAFDDTVSSSYTSLAGPTLTGLADGKYLVFHGCSFRSEDGFSARGWEALSVNGSTPSDSLANRCFLGGTIRQTGFRADEVTLSAGGEANTIEMLYRASVGNPGFGFRWMTAIRTA